MPQKVIKSKTGGVCIILSLIGCVYVKYVGISLPWLMELAFVNILFVGLGSFIASHNDLIKYTHLRLITAILIFIFSAFLNYNLSGYQVDEFMNKIGVIPLFYLAALSGIYSIVLIAQNIKSHRLVWLGRNSLLLYCLHFLLLATTNKIFEVVFGNLENWQAIVLGVAKALIIVILLVPVIRLINKKYAWVTGRF